MAIISEYQLRLNLLRTFEWTMPVVRPITRDERGRVLVAYVATDKINPTLQINARIVNDREGYDN